MPQVLSKCLRPSSAFTSTPGARVRILDKARKRCTIKRFNGQRKINKVNFVPVPTKTISVPPEEDWEREIEEFSHRIESEKPYDAEEDLKVALCEMCLYSVPRAPRPHQQHYDPSVHHTPPIKWVKLLTSVEMDQFADAEE